MHPEVEFTTVAFGEERVFRGHDGVREWWETLSARPGYDAYSSTATAIADDAILIRARIRAPNQSGGYLDAAALWLLVARDGLVWRYRPGGVRGRRARALRQGGALGLDERHRVRLAAPWPVRGLHE